MWASSQPWESPSSFLTAQCPSRPRRCNSAPSRHLVEQDLGRPRCGTVLVECVRLVSDPLAVEDTWEKFPIHLVTSHPDINAASAVLVTWRLATSHDVGITTEGGHAIACA